MERSVSNLSTSSGNNAKVHGRVTCWQFHECAAELRNNCPAYQLNAGRSCWIVRGTLCDRSDTAGDLSQAQKCHRCDFFIQVHARLI